MTGLLAALVMVAIPFVAVSALLALVERLQNRRDSERDRQIMLTDAIHWELGAAAAPVVSRRLRGGWRVFMAVPLDRPVEVAALLRVTQRHFSADKEGAESLEIVLTPSRSVVSPCAVDFQALRQAATDRALAA
ncbi:MAG TPA: hypothetical protein VGV06_12040 [Methylomirabilota bacterium]|nr:hypothetical protein [Methylomirabilota bacterium]